MPDGVCDREPRGDIFIDVTFTPGNAQISGPVTSFVLPNNKKVTNSVANMEWVEWIEARLCRDLDACSEVYSKQVWILASRVSHL